MLRSLPSSLRHRIKLALQALAKDPSGITNGLDVKRLDAEAGQPIYRLRVGDWQIAFTTDSVLVVFRVFHRSEGYAWIDELP
jgi:mRNA-degrading endonuclease RelE of RelBE toxin-antitoxin system